MHTALVSIIVPIYNVEKYLDRCIESIVKQSYLNLEIILVDDGSPDACPEICDKWANIDSRIKVVHKENGGASSARNAGLDIAKGEYICFVDSDDWIEPTYYSTVIPFMQEYNAEIACVGRYDVDSINMEKKIGLCPSLMRVCSSVEILKKILVWDECDSSVCDKVFLSNLWKNIRFPVGVISEDTAVLYRLIDYASRILMIDEPMYNYFHRNGSVTTSYLLSKIMHLPMLADDILKYMMDFHIEVLPEAQYFKFKTLLHWCRIYSAQKHPSKDEKTLYVSSRKWLLKQIFFVLFRSKRITIKDKLWYIMIVLNMKRLICHLIRYK